MPERPRGTVEEQIQRIYTYLWQVVEALNNIIHQIEKEGQKNGGA